MNIRCKKNYFEIAKIYKHKLWSREGWILNINILTQSQFFLDIFSLKGKKIFNLSPILFFPNTLFKDKGIESVISRNPPCNDDNARNSEKLYLIKYELDINVYNFKMKYFPMQFLLKVICDFLLNENTCKEL